MAFIALKKTRLDHYKIVAFKGIPLDTLADFLKGDAAEWNGSDNSDFEQDLYVMWLRDRDPKNNWTGGNTMEMVKQDNRVYLDSQFRESRADYSRGFSTTPEYMIRILRQWYGILAMDPLPDEVHLIQEGDDVIIVPKFNLCEDAFTGAVAIKA